MESIPLQTLLDDYDGFLEGREVGPANIENAAKVSRAICFAAAAYDLGHGDQAAHAMGRAFLLALIDPTHPDLDYLRRVPASGAVARQASEIVADLIAETKEGDE